jgi:hypothetical protein
MKRNAWRVLAALALTSIIQTAGFAAPHSTVAYEEGYQNETDALRAEMDSLRNELRTSMVTGYDDKKPTPAAAPGAGCGSCCNNCCQSCCNNGCGNCCNSCCNNGCDSCCNSCCCQPAGTCGCFEPCCHCAGVWASAEAIWFKYHRADGVRTGDEDENVAEYDLEITPRITVGYVGQDGLGARVRYWKFDHSATDEDEGFVSVDTYTFDVEVFDTFCLNRNWDLEIAAGIRYNDFEEILAEDEDDDDDWKVNEFNGFGIVASAELRRLVGTNGAIFVRARSAILMDNKNVTIEEDEEVELVDVVVGMTELAFGFDYVMPQCDGSYYFVRLQAEWQTWYNYSTAFAEIDDAEDFGAPSDVGFAGFGLGIGVAR